MTEIPLSENTRLPGACQRKFLAACRGFDGLSLSGYLYFTGLDQ